MIDCSTPNQSMLQSDRLRSRPGVSLEADRDGGVRRGPEPRPRNVRMKNLDSIRVLLVRAGQTQWEVAGRIGGSSDVPLSDAGVDHIRKCLDQLAGVKLATVYCGPDEASQATARELAAAAEAKVKVVDDLAEIHLGLWEGITLSELEDKCPTAYRQWMDDPASVIAPEGETIDDVQQRVLTVLAKTLDKSKPSQGPIAVVLRPFALGVVSCALDGHSCKTIWHKTRNGFLPEWREIHRTKVKEVRELANQPVRR